MRIGNDKGVSMLELMATLAVMGLMMAAAWPHVEGYRATLDGRQSLDVVTGVLDKARQRAITLHHRVEVRLGDPDERQYRIHEDRDNDGVIDDNETVLGPFTLPGAMTFGDIDLLGDGRLIFVPSGRLRTGEGGQIQLLDGRGHPRTLEVFGSGLTSIPAAG